MKKLLFSALFLLSFKAQSQTIDTSLSLLKSQISYSKEQYISEQRTSLALQLFGLMILSAANDKSYSSGQRTFISSVAFISLTSGLILNYSSKEKLQILFK